MQMARARGRRYRRNRLPASRNRTRKYLPRRQKTGAGLNAVRKQMNTRRHSRRYLEQTDSVIFVNETPCCCKSKVEREKFKSLHLDSALFLADKKPAKRVQSHISVITVSSSDGDIAVDRTAEWVAKVESSVDDTKKSCKEEAFIGDMEAFSSEGLTEQITNAETVREQVSLQQIPPQSSASPMEAFSQESQSSTSKKESNSCLNTTPPISFLTNPTVALSTNFSWCPTSNKSPHTITSNEGFPRDTEETVERSPKFIFGQLKRFNEIWNFRKTTADAPPSPLIINENASGSQQDPSTCSTSTSNVPKQTVDVEIDSQTLLQAPSTSKSPVINNIQQRSSGDGSQEGTSEF
ncbi:uncharacterized protein LOC124364383 isoform X1 [Homalodisca vitripennis]|uniref:uncharacterized protein LOC124364383 isoform X1 n=2 Tax=Homalodisca vitripennis TaxID=197043 RepID=UPI001EE9F2FF|nr:uncharacterized protein LOC124364383 isoform X1 [Homalodisca vitripennis]